MRKRIEINVGDRFGRLTVIKEAEKQYGHRYILVKCDCGKEKTVNLNSLIKGTSTSCGCYRKEYISQKNFRHGFSNRKKEIERLYRIWIGMKRRCCDVNDKQYHNYGARGITICEEWVNNYAVFREWAYKNGYADNLTIDRINNDDGYYPENCRWTTMQVQSNNRRVNHFVTYNGETHTLAEWQRITGIKDDLIGSRLKKGFPIEKVFYKGNLRYYKAEEQA